MPVATFLLCLAVLQSFLNSCRHTCCWEVREMVLFCPPSPLEAQSIQFTCWKEVRGLSSGHSVRQTNVVISHGQAFLQHNHISMTSHFLHSLYAMHSGEVRGGVWCRETFECSAALVYVSAWWHWIAQSPNHRAQHALTPSPPLAHLLSVCAGALQRYRDHGSGSSVPEQEARISHQRTYSHATAPLQPCAFRLSASARIW